MSSGLTSKIDLGVLTLNVHGTLYGLSINGEVHCFENGTESKVSTISTKGQTAKLVVVDKKGYKRPPGEISKTFIPGNKKQKPIEFEDLGEHLADRCEYSPALDSLITPYGDKLSILMPNKMRWKGLKVVACEIDSFKLCRAITVMGNKIVACSDSKLKMYLPCTESTLYRKETLVLGETFRKSVVAIAGYAKSDQECEIG